MSPLSLRVATGLAAVVLAETYLAVLFGFSRGWTVPVVMAAFAAGAWAWHRHGPRGEPPAPGSRRVVGLMAIALAGPLVWLPVPLDTDAQGFGYLALTVREGGTLTTLAPWRPDVAFLYAPGALLVLARVSSMCPWLSMSDVLLGVGHGFALLFVWVAGACGRELAAAFAGRQGAEATDTTTGGRWEVATVMAAAGSVGYWTALLDSHYTSTMALAFGVAWLAWWLRALRTGHAAACGATALVLAAVVVTHQDTAIVVGLGLVALGATGVLTVRAPAHRRVWTIVVGTPAVALVLLLPWMLHVVALLGTGITSPFERNPAYWRQAVLFHGVIWPAAALVGLAIWRRRPLAWAVALWLALVVDFATSGWLERLVPWLTWPVTRFDYPFSLAWHGPIVPYLVLGAATLVWAAGRVGIDLSGWPSRRVTVVLGLAVSGALVLTPRLATIASPYVSWHGAFATANDVEALRWIRTQSRPDARVLNYPGDYPRLRDWEGHWAPVVAERDAVYFRMQPFFLPGPALDAVFREQQALLAFWVDPADPRQAARLQAARIDFVVVPEVVNDPAAATWRGAPPALIEAARSRPADARYLRRVFVRGGAEVYAVEGAALP